jgi:urease accessory protein
MLITEKIGNINFYNINNRKIDYLMLEWHEANKRILHKQTVAGLNVMIELANENQSFVEGDIIYEDDFNIIVIEFKECDTIVLRPKTMLEMGRICNEIGIQQQEVFYQSDEILIAFDAALFRSFSAAGYHVSQEKRKLVTPLTKSNRHLN